MHMNSSAKTSADVKTRADVTASTDVKIPLPVKPTVQPPLDVLAQGEDDQRRRNQQANDYYDSTGWLY